MRFMSMRNYVNSVSPYLRVVPHRCGEFNVVKPYNNRNWFFTSRQLQEIPLGDLEESVKFISHTDKNGNERELLVQDTDPATKDLIYLHSAFPLNLANIVKAFKKGDPCIMNKRNVNLSEYYEWVDLTHVRCRFCGEILIRCNHPYYKRLCPNPSSYSPYHLKEGVMKKDLIIYKVSEAEHESIFDTRFGDSFLVIKPGENLVVSPNGLRLLNTLYNVSNESGELKVSPCFSEDVEAIIKAEEFEG